MNCRALILWQDTRMKSLLVFLPLLLFACSAPSQDTTSATPFNQLTLQAIRKMPTGGGYSGSDATKNKLTLASRATPEGLTFSPQSAQPSFCSGATYLVFLKTYQASLKISPPLAKLLIVTPDQQDGHGAFGRWNANGPGCAKFVADLGCGINFTSWEKAQPGDFLKIWWTRKIGGQERGHHVIYLGHDTQNVRFWSSNQPHGYGEKTIPISTCSRVLFTRITTPNRISRATQLPPKDPWLERMLKDDFTWQEVAAKCKVQQ